MSATDREQARQAAERRAAGRIERERAFRLHLLADVGRRTTAILSLSELLRSSVQIIQETFRYFMVNIFLADGEDLVLRACSMPEFSQSIGMLRMKIGLEGINGWVAKSGEPLNVSDVRLDPRYRYEKDIEKRTRSELAVPIVLKGSVIGVLDTQSESESAFNELDVFTLQTVAGQLAVAIENARLYEELQKELAAHRRTEQLLRASLLDLERTQEQLLQSQKMEAVGRLAGGVAHDFNNQLTAIMGYAEILLFGLPEGDSRRGEVEEILRASGRAAELTRQLLAFSRRQVLRPRVVDLNDLVREMRGMLQRLIGENIRLRTECAEVPLRVRADPAQIEQVIMNLAVNARDAMPEGGQLDIATRTEPSRTGYAEGPMHVMAVTDTGTGMTPEVMIRLFEPFFTTKEAGKGTGLGLSTAYGIVRQSGGHITCRSTPGEGTTFEISLPATREVDGEPRRPQPAAVAGGKERVLVIEDEEQVRQLVQRVLSDAGYSVITASSGDEAAEALRGPECVQMVITDLMLPGSLSGIDIARRVLSEDRGTRVLCISGYSEQLVSGASALPPAAPLLQKPFSAAELLERVRSILDAGATR